MSEKILDGITVLDASQWVTGGFATLTLANQGADVIKVERPGSGDDIRHSGPPFVEGESPYYWTVNYGKKSLELDLKSEEGLDVMYELAEDADVFVENFRPGKMADLGLGYDELRSRNDDLIYCSVSAFGQTGSLSERPGLDLLIQGLSGIMSVTGEEDGDPVKVGVALTDLVTAMWAGFAIVSALYKRERTGEGEYIDIGMLDAMIPWLTKQAGKAMAGETPGRMGSRDPFHAPYQAYEAADGYINIACGNQGTWKRLCEALDRTDLLNDERFETNPDRAEHMDELETEIEETLAERSVDEWVEILAEEHSIPAGPILTVGEALDHEQVGQRGMIGSLEHATAGEQSVIEHPINYRNAEQGFDSHAPVLGQHSRDVLRGLGYDEASIEDLVDRGVIGESGLEDE